jgi:ABC-type molybdate transport system substrate-binding protein
MKTILGLLAAVALVTTPLLVHAESVEIRAAGSLRGVVADLTSEAKALGIEIKSDFGGSGALRERTEKGEHVDLFLSADVGSPRKLAAASRTVLPAIPFARNRMCIVSRKSAGVTPKNLVDRLLDKNVRVKTSTPIVDPSGDYAWSIFDRIDRQRAGTGAVLKAKAQSIMNVTATAPAPGQSAAAALFAEKKIDMWITYCSASVPLEKEQPELTSFEVPPQLDPHPVNGAAVLSNRPEVLRVALYLLSEKGQAILTRNGLVPLTSPPAP